VIASPGSETGLPAGEYVALAVTDAGSGIEPEMLQQVMEPFFTTKDVGKGTGLGLSMVYGFARQSGGAFQIQSEVGVGTRAEIWLPRGHPAVFVPGEGIDAKAESERPAAIPGRLAKLVGVHDVAVADHRHDAAQRAELLRRIAVDQHHVGFLADRDRAGALVGADDARRDDGRALQRLAGVKPACW
jgi:hypothetical protein